MASSKDIQPSARPLTQHRLSLSSGSSTLTRLPHARTSSHSLLTGSLNPTHRVTRRKSVTNPNGTTNVAAIEAAIRDVDATAALAIAGGSRRNTLSKSSAARNGVVGSLPSPPASLPHSKYLAEKQNGLQGSAIDDSNEMSGDEGSLKTSKARIRRASDGQPLTKDGKKSNRVEVRCEQCGKGYKHSSCLTKHLWEHTPEWAYTSKLLISKHQQVQLLEAASVLVTMNGDPKDASVTPPPESAHDVPSDLEPFSPAASGYSDPVERQSSADTTPPPTLEGLSISGLSQQFKRGSSAGGLSRSYQSAPGAGSLVTGSVPSGRGHFRQPSFEDRPPSSGDNKTGQDDRDLAAAVELLSCSFGSNGGSRGMVTLPVDAPPVPPVPAQYLEHTTPLSNAGFLNSFPTRQPESFTRGEMRRESVDVKMEESGESGVDEDDFDRRSRARSDEEDDFVFGRMEE